MCESSFGSGLRQMANKAVSTTEVLFNGNVPWVTPISSLHSHEFSEVSSSVLLGMVFTFSMIQDGPHPPSPSFLLAQSFAANLPA